MAGMKLDNISLEVMKKDCERLSKIYQLKHSQIMPIPGDLPGRAPFKEGNTGISKEPDKITGHYDYCIELTKHIIPSMPALYAECAAILSTSHKCRKYADQLYASLSTDDLKDLKKTIPNYSDIDITFSLSATPRQDIVRRKLADVFCYAELLTRRMNTDDISENDRTDLEKTYTRLADQLSFVIGTYSKSVTSFTHNVTKKPDTHFYELCKREVQETLSDDVRLMSVRTIEDIYLSLLDLSLHGLRVNELEFVIASGGATILCYSKYFKGCCYQDLENTRIDGKSYRGEVKRFFAGRRKDLSEFGGSGKCNTSEDFFTKISLALPDTWERTEGVNSNFLRDMQEITGIDMVSLAKVYPINDHDDVVLSTHFFDFGEGLHDYFDDIGETYDEEDFPEDFFDDEMGTDRIITYSVVYQEGKRIFKENPGPVYIHAGGYYCPLISCLSSISLRYMYPMRLLAKAYKALSSDQTDQSLKLEELDRLRKEAEAKADHFGADLRTQTSKNAALEKRIKSLESENLALQRRIRELEKERDRLENLLVDDNEAEESGEELLEEPEVNTSLPSLEEMCTYITKTGRQLVIVAGADSWQSDVCRLLPNIKYVRAHNCNYDVAVTRGSKKEVYVNTMELSHALFYRVKSNSSNIHFVDSRYRKNAEGFIKQLYLEYSGDDK